MSQDEHFEFVKSLALELNRNEVSLTSFPDVVVRIRKALDDPNTSAGQVAEILSVDPVLASRVLLLANSSFHNPSGIKIENLNAAIGRIGLNEVRTAAITYAVEQIHASEKLAALKDELRKTWSIALRLGAMSEVMARQCTKLDGDTAFLAGLLNQIGVLYIFSKHDEYPDLLQDPEARQALIDEWAAPIGQSIVADWNFSEEIQATLNPDREDRARPGLKVDLADVVTTAKEALNDERNGICDSAEAKRMQLTQDQLPLIDDAFQQKLDSLVTAVR